MPFGAAFILAGEVFLGEHVPSSQVQVVPWHNSRLTQSAALSHVNPEGLQAPSAQMCPASQRELLKHSLGSRFMQKLSKQTWLF